MGSKLEQPRSLGELLEHVRTEAGLNLTQAAAELGAARTAYRLWEKDAATPDPEKWQNIALWCDVPLAKILRLLDLLTDEEEEALLKLAARELRRRS